MVEALRLRLLGRLLPRIKAAEQFAGDGVHIIVHPFQVALKQRLIKCVLHAPALPEPSPDHLQEHIADLQIGQPQIIFHFHPVGIEPGVHRF